MYQQQTTRLSNTATSHPDDPIPHEPEGVPEFKMPLRRKPAPASSGTLSESSGSSEESAGRSNGDFSDSDAVSTPRTEAQASEIMDKIEELPAAAISVAAPQPSKKRRTSTTLINGNTQDIRRLLSEEQGGTQVIEKFCCGGGCCQLANLVQEASIADPPIKLPTNAAFAGLDLKLGSLSLETELTNIIALPFPTISFVSVPSTEPHHVSHVHSAPPKYVKPHPPYDVVSAPVFHARELTKQGSEKRTYHFDIDVTNYPAEDGVTDFKVGGAIGICPPNEDEMVDDLFDALGVPSFVRDKPVLMRTTGGRWPTIWGKDEPRELVTTRREILTWCTDIQSSPPVKPLLRLMAEYADVEQEKKILLYLCSAEGQASFCDLRTGPHITITQLLHAFPSSRPPLHELLSTLKQLMPRFYSLSNDPHVSSERTGIAGRRLIEIAVSVHETPDWHGGHRTGVGSGYLERIARKFIDAEADGLTAGACVNLSIPIFRGLMANPLSKEFVSDGPMMLIGAGVGMAPFRGFILNRLKNANCANKIWLVQGVRDAALDAIYSGELGDHEGEIKSVVQSRKRDRKVGEAKYVQDEVRVQADVVWYVANAIDGRVFVCGSSKGMGEGVEEALIDVAVEKGNLSRDEARDFWMRKKEGGQYIAETW